MAIGKLNGVIAATTPIGLRVTRICAPARRGEDLAGLPVALAAVVPQDPSGPADFADTLGAGLALDRQPRPQSAALRSITAAASAGSPRWWMGVPAHGRAARAASTAVSSSAVVVPNRLWRDNDGRGAGLTLSRLEWAPARHSRQ